jgi:hypothetical protein
MLSSRVSTSTSIKTPPIPLNRETLKGWHPHLVSITGHELQTVNRFRGKKRKKVDKEKRRTPIGSFL